jgi:hypothetical protein
MRRRLKAFMFATKEALGDFSAYKYVEFASNVYRYVPPKMILESDLDAEIAKTNNTNLFVSRYRCRGPDPFFGPMFSDFYIDIDSEDRPQEALNDARKVVSWLINVAGLDENVIVVHFTGMKGFCIEVPFECFGAKPSEFLPLIWRRIAQTIQKRADFKHLDTSVYDRRRLWRVTNSIHGSSKRYKIMLQRGELFTKSLDDIRTLATTAQPKLERAQNVAVSIVLQELYDNTFEQIEKSTLQESEKKREEHAHIPSTFSLDRVFHCTKKLLAEGVKEGTYGREPTAMYIAASLRDCGATQEQALELVKQFAERCEPELPQDQYEHAVDCAFKSAVRSGCTTPCFADICAKECKEKCFIYNETAAEALTPERRAAAEEFLLRPTLLFDVHEAMADHIGDDEQKVVGFLIIVGGLSVEVQALRSSGKSDLVKKILRCLPQEWWEEFSGMSDKALRYLGKHIRILFFSERGAMQHRGEETTAAFDAKIIMSDGKLSVLVPVKDKDTGEIRSQPVVSEVKNIVTTSTRLDIPEELDTRLLIMNVDESERQNERFVKHFLHEVATLKSDRQNLSKTKTLVSDAVRLFDEEAPKNVVIPYAERLSGLLDMTDPRVRRDVQKLTTLIECVTRFHYKQRPIIVQQVGDEQVENVVWTVADLALVIEVGLDTWLQTCSGLTQQVITALRVVSAVREISTSTLADIPEVKSLSQAKRYIYALLEKGLLVQSDKRGNLKIYELTKRAKDSGIASIFTPDTFSVFDCQKDVESCANKHHFPMSLTGQLYSAITGQPLTLEQVEKSLKAKIVSSPVNEVDEVNEIGHTGKTSASSGSSKRVTLSNFDQELEGKEL